MKFTEPEGTNFRPQQEVALATLKLALGRIYAFLKSREPSPSLFRYDDWWEHDGLHTLRDKLTWARFKATIADEAEIIESMPGDFNVKVGIASPAMNWYLRYYVDLEDESKECFFDITVPGEWEKDFRNEVEKALPIDWVTEKSAVYYKGIRLE